MPIRRISLVVSAMKNVYENLAREELLFDALGEEELCFLLYVNSPSIVIGKHQNPWRECATRLLGSDLALARRISGGGTVYHDEGNLNFSFLMPKAHFDRRRNLELIVRALSSLGVRAELSSRYDLLAGGRKISGNAFCFRRDRALHHGTLLIESGLSRLREALRGLPGISTSAVASQPQPVVNLTELYPSIDARKVRSALLEELVKSWGGEAIEVSSFDDGGLDAGEVRRLADRNREWDWIFGRTPRFTATIGGGIELCVEEGRVASVGAPGSGDGAPGIAALVVGRIFDSRVLDAALGSAREGIREVEAVREWLRAHPF